jgi:helix-turn-helix protein
MTIASNTTISTVSIPDGADDDLLTLSEVAAILRMSVNTLRWWRQCGKGPRFFKIGRHLVTTIGYLRAWINEQKRTADQDRPGAG